MKLKKNYPTLFLSEHHVMRRIGGMEV